MIIAEDWILFVIRIILATSLIYYGWPKLKNPKSNTESFQDMGYRPAFLFSWTNIGVEFFGGVLLLFNVLSSVIAYLVAFQMLTGLFWKLGKKPFIDWSYDLLLFGLCLPFLGPIFGIVFSVEILLGMLALSLLLGRVLPVSF